MSKIKSFKVLVSSFNFNPIAGSECSVGWNYVRAIASRHKVWVATRSVEKEDIEAYLENHPDEMPNLTVEYVHERFRNIDSALGKITNYLRYKSWQRDAYQRARVLDAQVDFDLIHHVTGTGFREPGHMWKLSKPFIWGPVGGLQFFPLRLLGAVPFGSRPFFILKNFSTLWAMHISSPPRHAAMAAKAILAGTSGAAEKVQRLWGRDATVSCEVSAPALEPMPIVRRDSKTALQIVWSGTCEPRKALNIVLQALDRLKGSTLDWRLIAVGDGPLWGYWKALAERLGIGDRCSFPGRVSRTEVLSIMASSHCLVQPSLYDATTTVVAEALAHGLPIICLNHFGFKDVVDASCGIKISPHRLDQIIDDFADAIKTIGMDEDLRYQMAISAQKASQRLSWKYKEEIINSVYSQVLPEMRSDSAGAIHSEDPTTRL